MDVINHISKVVVDSPGLPDAEVLDAPGASPYGNQSPHVLNGPRIHEFLQEMHREVFAGRPPGLINIGEMPGTTRGARAPLHRPGARASSTWSSSSSTSTSTRARGASGTWCR